MFTLARQCAKMQCKLILYALLIYYSNRIRFSRCFVIIKFPKRTLMFGNVLCRINEQENKNRHARSCRPLILILPAIQTTSKLLQPSAYVINTAFL